MSAARPTRVAVLGAGLMGSATALFLARGGCTVTLFEQAEAPMQGASCWNEGKIHLGHLYAADPSMRTAREVVDGGLRFRPLVEELIGGSLAATVTPQRDTYLVHPGSVVSAEAMGAYFARLDELLKERGGSYLGPLTPIERLTAGELEALAGGAVVAGFRVPERSVDTRVVADRIVEALEAEARIDFRPGHRVEGVEPADGSWEGRWRVRHGAGAEGPYDQVVNALWEGRLLVDASCGLRPEPGWSHRYRLSLFADLERPLDLPSAVLATGPFGDVKNYGNGRFYLSWYAAGLMAEGEEVAPPPIRLPEPARVIEEVRRGLTGWLPAFEAVFAAPGEILVGGGWVYARGKGALSDPAASLHRRDLFGVTRRGAYFSVDTGKYSCAPWLARKLADQLTAA